MMIDPHKIRSHQVTEGLGPKDSICLLLHRNGMGDDIHSMPAIAAKIAEGFNITVYSRPFTRRCFESLGCIWHHQREADSDFMKLATRQYGQIISATQWCTHHELATNGKPVLDRFEQFAKILDVDLPREFSWLEALMPGASRSPRESITLASYSDATTRSYPHAISLREMMLDAYGNEVYPIGPILHQSYFDSFDELLLHITKSKLVVATDSGILAVALALNVPTIAIFGPTDERIVAEQFRRYHDDLILHVIRSEREDRCHRPCGFHPANGYAENSRCVSFADCLAEIQPEEIMLLASQLLELSPSTGKEVACLS